jgi:hypothetical protein
VETEQKERTNHALATDRDRSDRSCTHTKRAYEKTGETDVRYTDSKDKNNVMKRMTKRREG